MKWFTRKSVWAGLLVSMALVTLYAQEPQYFRRGIVVYPGNFDIGGVTGNQICMEGATADAFETCIAVTDPTADRLFTFADGSNTFANLAMTELSEVVTATNVLTAGESGSTFYLNAAAGFLTTLPAPALGQNYKFVVKTAPTSNGYTIGTPTANIIYGMVLERVGTAGVACATEDLLVLEENASLIGDWLEIRSDATNWYVYGMVDAAAGFTCSVT